MRHVRDLSTHPAVGIVKSEHLERRAGSRGNRSVVASMLAGSPEIDLIPGHHGGSCRCAVGGATWARGREGLLHGVKPGTARFRRNPELCRALLHGRELALLLRQRLPHHAKSPLPKLLPIMRWHSSILQ